jgi:hypothetical protein
MSDESEGETQWTPSAKEAYAASVEQLIASTANVIVHQNDSTAWIDGDEDPFAVTRED